MQTLERINLINLRKCNQVWEEMTPNEKGRVCQKCQNTIIDFRDLSDKEIAEIHTFSSGQVCGLYDKRQLQLQIAKPQKRVGIKAIYIGFLGMISTITANAQIENDSIKIIQTDSGNSKIKTDYNKSNSKPQKANDIIIISGTLTDETGEGTMFANVHIKGTKIGTTSDIDGKYYLDITQQLDSLKQIILVYSYVGYNSEERAIDVSSIEKQENRTINIAFNNDGIQFTEFYVVVNRPLPVRIWNRIKRVFKR